MTDLSPPEHETSAAVDEAARFLATEAPAPHPIIPALKERFGLTAGQVIEAIRQSRLVKAHAI